MSEEEDRPGEREEERDQSRFPVVPAGPDVPEVPRLAQVQPPAPRQAGQRASEPGSYRDQALAYSAVSQFIMPIIVLGVGGWLLQNRFHFAPWGVLIGFVVGFIVGVMSLLRVLNRMNR